MKLNILISLFFISALQNAYAQQANLNRKGKMFANWGWNHAVYTKSTLSMKGDDYNLTIHKMKAHDRQTQFSYHNYFQIDRVTIPQTNMRLGYFVRNNVAVLLGVDHMKYVMDQNQTAFVTGNITREGAYKKPYNGYQVLSDDFLTFEHTDGLNLIHVGVEYYKNLLQSTNKKNRVELIFGGNLGVMMPKTNVKFLNYERTDRFHVSGIGVGLKAAVQGVLLNHIILRGESILGYITMPNIVLHKTGINGRGSQHFGYAQLNGEIGYLFNLKKQK